MKRRLVDVAKTPPTAVERQAAKLVYDLKSGNARFIGSKNKYPNFPGKNERRDHYGYIAFLGTRDGERCIDGMKRQDAIYEL